MNTTQVLIAGAGPTGLMLGLWLTKLGIDVKIVDPKPGPAEETRAIVVQARTLEFYDQLGLGQEALSRGRHIDRVNLWTRGDLRASVRFDGVGRELTPHPYLYILTQDQNEALLVEALKALGVQVDWETALSGFEQAESGVTASLTHAEHTQTVRAAYLAGCDGASSAVRHQLGIPLSGGTYSQRFFVADVVASGELHENDFNMSLDGDQFLAFFPLPGRHHHRIVGQLPPDAGEHPSVEAVRPQIDRQQIAKVEDVQWFSTYNVHHRVADQFQAGRVLLLGDAAHVHSPVGGQGMNTGLGDAANAAWKLAQAVTGDPAALASYGPERRPFAATLVKTTDRAFSGVINPSPLARLIRNEWAPVALKLLGRSPILRRLLFLTLSQLRIRYPTSPLSVGRAGRVSGGERLPWVNSESGGNFEALQSLSWQVHVYGAPSPEILTWCGQWQVPLHVFGFGRGAQQAGFSENAFYLVRPDGYVGMAAPEFEWTAAEKYAERWLPAAAETQKVGQQVTALV
ncbi:FAD-dependent oxidoreductase (plasmid) [Deinococcus psychrotolerans]|uniref:FAD-dependent oxidoreductase n=1 Tax=Deinococcus psychrotolerans TaxID=2489213 RepID=A0A3G8YH81_9DEIO|nr:FAD-dependent monooxygenase [Deinococcus psychrotolerans]AZI44652.1 FAD-dependent oxidoreductase [Deinococcus psychrotolerans]